MEESLQSGQQNRFVTSITPGVQDLPQDICTGMMIADPALHFRCPELLALIESARKYEPGVIHTGKWAWVFFFPTFKYPVSVFWVFSTLLSAIFVKRQDWCPFFDTIFSVPLKKKSSSVTDKGPQERFCDALSAGEVLVGVTQHLRKGYLTRALHLSEAVFSAVITKLGLFSHLQPVTHRSFPESSACSPEVPGTSQTLILPGL